MEEQKKERSLEEIQKDFDAAAKALGLAKFNHAVMEAEMGKQMKAIAELQAEAQQVAKKAAEAPKA